MKSSGDLTSLQTDDRKSGTCEVLTRIEVVVVLGNVRHQVLTFNQVMLVKVYPFDDTYDLNCCDGHQNNCTDADARNRTSCELLPIPFFVCPVVHVAIDGNAVIDRDMVIDGNGMRVRNDVAMGSQHREHQL
jgi:hypothetical protein